MRYPPMGSWFCCDPIRALYWRNLKVCEAPPTADLYWLPLKRFISCLFWRVHPWTGLCIPEDLLGSLSDLPVTDCERTPLSFSHFFLLYRRSILYTRRDDLGGLCIAVSLLYHMQSMWLWTTKNAPPEITRFPAVHLYQSVIGETNLLACDLKESRVPIRVLVMAGHPKKDISNIMRQVPGEKRQYMRQPWHKGQRLQQSCHASTEPAPLRPHLPERNPSHGGTSW